MTEEQRIPLASFEERVWDVFSVLGCADRGKIRKEAIRILRNKGEAGELIEELVMRACDFVDQEMGTYRSVDPTFSSLLSKAFWKSFAEGLRRDISEGLS